MDSLPPAPNVPIPEEHKLLFQSVDAFVREYMSSPAHDNSHDYFHILRVVSNANALLSSETSANPTVTYDNLSLFLAALLHDVGDYKYAKPGDDPENQVSNVLIAKGADEKLAEKVQVMVKNVGYTNEVKNPQTVASTIAQYPELAIVQDADRLDAIGAIGVARCFAYGGAKTKGEPIQRAIGHFEEKLFKLTSMMKTASGKRLAEEKHNFMVKFAQAFQDDIRLSV